MIQLINDNDSIINNDDIMLTWQRGIVMRRGRLTRFKLADVQPCKKRMHHVLVSTLSRCAFVPSLSWQTFGVWHKTAFRIRREGVFRTIG
jgi:hypothetical protein